ncbi:MAG: hypothetical protein FWH22_00540 [Fibromonadales bacterium]|nr:hypothetical protein [Fibromonadales bacterium]
MQINHNIRAMVAQHALFQNNNAMSKSLEKLSTGFRINRAQDDAAGLAMSEQMRTQIRGLGKAKQNALDGIAALQIAEGGLSEITNAMQRQRELSIQSANDTLTDTERYYLNQELQELTKEISRISLTTDYNGKNLLNKSGNPNTSFAATPKDPAQTSPASGPAPSSDPTPISGTHTAIIQTRLGGGGSWQTIDLINVLDSDGMWSRVNGSSYVEIRVSGWDPSDPSKADWANVQVILNQASSSMVAGIRHVGGAGEIITTANGTSNTNFAVNHQFTPDPVSGDDGDDGDDSETAPIVDPMAAYRADSWTLHIGPNFSIGLGGIFANQIPVTYTAIQASSSDLLNLRVGNVNFKSLSLLTQGSSTNATDQLDEAIKEISGVRAKIGTFINRLEYTVNNIANLEFNTQDAESRIRDTDFAKETTNFTRNQIMVQSATSVLAQANMMPMAVLSLLG